MARAAIARRRNRMIRGRRLLCVALLRSFVSLNNQFWLDFGNLLAEFLPLGSRRMAVFRVLFHELSSKAHRIFARSEIACGSREEFPGCMVGRVRRVATLLHTRKGGEIHAATPVPRAEGANALHAVKGDSIGFLRRGSRVERGTVWHPISGRGVGVTVGRGDSVSFIGPWEEVSG